MPTRWNGWPLSPASPRGRVKDPPRHMPKPPTLTGTSHKPLTRLLGILVRMRQAFAHDATLLMPPDADIHAPGAGITTELCGHWEHEPPCPLAPHHIRADRGDDEVRLRILFAAEPDLEDTVRQRIDKALSRGQLPGPEGGHTRWRLRLSRRSEVSPEETDHAARLTRG